MSRATFEQAVGLLGSLSQAELEQLGTRLAALRALSGPAPVSRPSPQATGAGQACDCAFEGLLYDALAEALLAETGAKQQPFPLFLRTSAGKAFQRAACLAGAAHAQWFPKASRAQTAGLCRVYASSLVGYLSGKGKPLFWSVISSAVADLPEVLSESFPGYAKAGVMSMLLRERELPG